MGVSDPSEKPLSIAGKTLRRRQAAATASQSFARPITDRAQTICRRRRAGARVASATLRNLTLWRLNQKSGRGAVLPFAPHWPYHRPRIA